MSWRLKLKEQRKLRSEGAKTLFDRVTILMQIELDQDFIDHCDSNGTNVYEQLDAEVADVGHGYGVLKAVMAEYPDRDQWGKSLAILVAEIREKRRRPTSGDERVSWKQVAEERAREIERLRAEVIALSARISELQGVIQVMSGRSPRDVLTGASA